MGKSQFLIAPYPLSFCPQQGKAFAVICYAHYPEEKKLENHQKVIG